MGSKAFERVVSKRGTQASARRKVWRAHPRVLHCADRARHGPQLVIAVRLQRSDATSEPVQARGVSVNGTRREAVAAPTAGHSEQPEAVGRDMGRGVLALGG